MASGGRAKIALVIASGALVVVAAVLVFALIANGRVLPQTSIGTVSVGYQTQVQAEQQLQQLINQASSQPVQLSLDGTLTQIPLGDLGVTIDQQGTRAQLTARTFEWGTRNPFVAAGDALVPTELQAVLVVKQDVLDQVLPGVLAPHTTPAINAHLVLTDGVRIVQEQVGSGFDLSAVREAVLTHIRTLQTDQLQLSSETLTPTVIVQDLQPVLRQAQAVLARDVTLITGQQTHTIGADTVATWLTYDQAGRMLTLNSAAVGATLEPIAAKVDVAPVPTKKIAGTDAVVQEGNAGFALDLDSAIAVIGDMLLGVPAQHDIELELVTIPAPVEEVSNAVAPSSMVGKEIVIDLSEQRLYAWEDGELARSYLISAGLTYPTYLGTFSVFSKIESHTMAGADYYLPGVPHSMYYDGLRAIHGAYWHDNFGNPMSHGCINEPLDQAEWLYNWTPMGTTVRVVE